VKPAVRLFKPGAKGQPIDDAPGVYEAPEVEGTHWPQVGLTLLMETVAVGLGFGICALLGH
jgi:hypothetical protein